MTLFEAIIQGIIQGLTEFLPVSSSGHLSIYQHFTGISGESSAFFSIALHVGTLLSMFIAFRKTIGALILEFFNMIGDLFKGRYQINMNPNRKMIKMLFLAFLPMLAVVFLKDFYAAFSADDDIVVEGVCLMLTGMLIFLGEKYGNGRKTAKNMTGTDALAVGIMQAIAPMPGLSRSGSTVAVGRMRGLTKEYAITFSFILGIPAVMGAAVLEIPEVLQNGLSVDPMVLMVGVLVSCVVGLFAIGLLKWLMANDKFMLFSYYTLIAGTLITAIGAYEHITGNFVRFFS